MKLNYTRPASGFGHNLFRWSLRRVSRSFVAYHPVSLQGETLQPGQRACIDRWAMIAGELRAAGARSLLDLGCAEGYFVRRAAGEADHELVGPCVERNQLVAVAVGGGAHDINRVGGRICAVFEPLDGQ